ncbi:ArnT family glycosyltransferase [Enhygromyxa salina]|uniref:ArnT family glycosyltransferase n=1 Tax=Enhygromyxa salina TaxID=215803 RepID=UPI000697348A|nr:glycosyltransferase family 39 protein [Enhygromyxa salina]
MDVDAAALKPKPAVPVSLNRRVSDWFGADRKRRWWVLVLFVAALIVRLNWNLNVHPHGEYIYSDMKGYWGRADSLLDDPFSVREYDAFFPFGTTWLVAGIKWVFGRDCFGAIAVIYAVFGASIVAASYAIADRIMGARLPWIAPAVGLFLVVYYPLIAIGGYVLSELPFSFCLTLAVLMLIRVVDEGRGRDAWLLGLLLGLGMLIRPQVILSVALIGSFWLVARWRWRGSENPYAKLRWAHIGYIAVPLGLLLTMSAIRFHVHTGRVGLVSENSSINLVFGRCHNKGIYSRPDGEGHGTIRFSPPPLIQLEAHTERNPNSLIQVKSVWGDHPEPLPEVPGFAIDEFGCTRRACREPGSEIEYRGYIGDGEIHKKIVKACLVRGGVKRQAYFTFTHWVMLWRTNLMWPDQANPRPRSTDPDEGWRHRQEVWSRIHRALLMVPALLGLGFVFAPRRRPKEALVSLNFWALMVVTGVWLGGARFRVPYDPIIVLLAAFSYGVAWEQARKLWAKLKARRSGAGSAPAGGEPE